MHFNGNNKSLCGSWEPQIEIEIFCSDFAPYVNLSEISLSLSEAKSTHKSVLLIIPKALFEKEKYSAYRTWLIYCLYILHGTRCKWIYYFDNFQNLSSTLPITKGGSKESASITGGGTTRPPSVRRTTAPRSIFMSQIYSIGGLTYFTKHFIIFQPQYYWTDNTKWFYPDKNIIFFKRTTFIDW